MRLGGKPPRRSACRAVRGARAVALRFGAQVSTPIEILETCARTSDYPRERMAETLMNRDARWSHGVPSECARVDQGEAICRG